MPICEKCNKSFKNWIKIDNALRNVSNRKYCLLCSPFNVHNTKKLIGNPKHKLNTRKNLCYKCGQTNPLEFYGKNKILCSKCTNEYKMESGKKKRDYILDVMGRKCSRCGYAEFDVSLDMHHIDSNSKDEAFNCIRYWSQSRIDKEIKKCILLCKNCHAGVHNKKFDIQDIVQRQNASLGD